MNTSHHIHHHPTIRIINGMVENFGPLTGNTRMLVKLSALATIGTIDEVHTFIKHCLISGIAPSEIYQTIFNITDIIGFNNALDLLTITQDSINEL